MRRRKTDCFQLSVNPKLTELFFPLLIIFSLTSVERTFCQVNPSASILNPHSFQNNPYAPLPPPVPRSIVWPHSTQIQSYQSWPQHSQVPSPFLGYPPAIQRTFSSQHLPSWFGVVSHPISQSTPLYPATAGLAPSVAVDGSLGSRVHPLKDVTGIWNKLAISGGGGKTNLLSTSSGATNFIPGSLQLQIQRISTPTSLTGTSYNPFLGSPLLPPGLSAISRFPPDSPSRYQVSPSLDPAINNQLGHLSMINHRANIERNSLASRMKFQIAQNQMLGLQTSPVNLIQSGQSSFL